MHRIRLAALTLLTACVGYGQAPAYATIYTFKGGTDGAAPNGVVLTKNGDLYGTTKTGGVNECGINISFWCGSVFQLTPAEGGTWAKTIIFSFNGTDEGLPSWDWEGGPGARPVFGANGALYGTTENGGENDPSANFLGGTVWELMPPSAAGGAWTETVLYSFQDNPQDPNSPYGGLLVTSTGLVIGTTFTNDYPPCCLFEGGTAFELVPPSESGGSWTLSNLINFETAGIGGTLPQGSRPWAAHCTGRFRIFPLKLADRFTSFRRPPPQAAPGRGRRSTLLVGRQAPAIPLRPLPSAPVECSMARPS